MEVRLGTEAGHHMDPTRRLSASPTRIKNSSAKAVTQSTATLARKVSVTYFLLLLCKDALVTDQIPSNH